MKSFLADVHGLIYFLLCGVEVQRAEDMAPIEPHFNLIVCLSPMNINSFISLFGPPKLHSISSIVL